MIVSRVIQQPEADDGVWEVSGVAGQEPEDAGGLRATVAGDGRKQGALPGGAHWVLRDKAAGDDYQAGAGGISQLLLPNMYLTHSLYQFSLSLLHWPPLTFHQFHVDAYFSFILSFKLVCLTHISVMEPVARNHFACNYNFAAWLLVPTLFLSNYHWFSVICVFAQPLYLSPIVILLAQCFIRMTYLLCDHQMVTCSKTIYIITVMYSGESASKLFVHDVGLNSYLSHSSFCHHRLKSYVLSHLNTQS